MKQRGPRWKDLTSTLYNNFEVHFMLSLCEKETNKSSYNIDVCSIIKYEYNI